MIGNDLTSRRIPAIRKMSDAVLNLSLDDIIKQKKLPGGKKTGPKKTGPSKFQERKQKQAGKPVSRAPTKAGVRVGSKPNLSIKRGRGGGIAKQPRAPIRNMASPPKVLTVPRPSLRSAGPPPAQGKWRHDMFSGNQDRQPVRREAQGFKLHVTNLDYNVSEKDINELFAAIPGNLLRCKIHYDK